LRSLLVLFLFFCTGCSIISANGNGLEDRANVRLIDANEAPLLEDCDGLLGMQYFSGTVMVLDFERELMWVKSS